MMKYITTILFLLLCHSCGSTSIVKKVELQRLAWNHPVTVYETKPTFGYQVICEANVQRYIKGFGSTDMAAYVSNAKEIARKCGVDKAILENLDTQQYLYQSTDGLGMDYEINVKILAIKQTSEGSKLTDMDKVKKLGMSAALENLDAMTKLMEGVSKNRMDRSPHDQGVLELMLFVIGQKGSSCSNKISNFLMNEYEVRIENLNRRIDGLMMQPGAIAYCPNVLLKSYESVQNRVELISYIISAAAVTLAQYQPTGQYQKRFDSLRPLLVKASAEINESCNQSDVSELCLFREKFVEIKKLLEQLAMKYKKSPSLQLTLDEVNRGLFI